MKKFPLNSLARALGCPEGVVVLSPHLDDAALSVGASIAALVESGTRLTVLTVFAGSPPLRAKLLSKTLALWKVGTYGARREEDIRAMSILGCDFIHGDHPEALFRHARAGSIDKAISCGCQCPACEQTAMRVVGDLTSWLNRLNPAWLLLPAATGFHIDHELVSRAGRAAAQGRKLEVLRYEELPYAVGSIPVRPGRQEVAERHLHRKLRAVAEYRSQLPSLAYVFGEVADLLAARASLLATPPGRLAELVSR